MGDRDNGKKNKRILPDMKSRSVEEYLEKEGVPQTLQRTRAASIAGLSSPIKSEKSDVTNTSSLEGQKGNNIRNVGSGGSSTSPSGGGQFTVPASNKLKRTYSGRQANRQSGLFSRDEMSVDVSLSPSEKYQQFGRKASGNYAIGLSLNPGGGEGGDKRHPLSMAGSSIGSSSLGSGLFDEGALGEDDKKHLYKPFRRKWRRFQRKYRGCIFALLSSLTSSLASYFVRQLTGEPFNYSPVYCLLWRYFGVLFPGIFIVLFYRFYKNEMVFDTIWPLNQKPTVKRFILSILRAVLDVGAVYLNYQAFKYLLQSETSTILNSKPIIVQLLAHFTLGEAWGFVPIIMSVVAAIGVMIISKPPFLDSSKEGSSTFINTRFPGVMLAMGSMLLASIVYCILRYLKDVHYSVFSLFIGSIGFIFGLGMVIGIDDLALPKNGIGWAYFMAVAALVCLSSISIVIALQNEEAFVVSLVRSCDVIFSFIWEITTKQYPDWYSGGGAMIIMFCVFVIFFRKYLTHQRPDSKVYKRFHFLTK